MDLLDFDPEPLYFEDPLSSEVTALLDRAAEHYGSPEAESALAEAARLAPDHLLVLVARYRYHFYRHQLAQAREVVWHAIKVSAARVGLPPDGCDLSEPSMQTAAKRSMTTTRFYLSALKAAAYIDLRQGRLRDAIALLETLVNVDDADRMGGRVLLDVALDAANPSPTDS